MVMITSHVLKQTDVPLSRATASMHQVVILRSTCASLAAFTWHPRH